MKKLLSRKNGLDMAAVLILLLGLASYCCSVLPVFRSVLRDYLALNEAQFGFLLSIGAVPGALGALLAGLWARRSSTKRVVPAALLSVALSLLGLGLARTYATMVFMLAWNSFSYQALVVSAQGHLVAMFPGNRRQVLAWQLVGTSAFGVFFTLVAEKMLTQVSNGAVPFPSVLHLPFIGIGICLLVAIPWILRRNSLAPAKTPTATTSGQTARTWNPWIALTMAALFLHGTADSTLFIWLPRLLEQEGYQSFKPGYVLSAYALVYVGSRAILAMLPEKTLQRSFILLPGLLGGGLWLLGLSLRGSWAATAYVAGAFFWSCEFPAFLAVLGNQTPRSFPALLAITTMFSGLGVTGLSTLFGWLWDCGALPLPAILAFPGVMFAAVSLIGGILVAHGQEK
ncbi:MAG TPA: MFS transporter [Lentisphaeria bacterium]|nr:MFS transporter [Lentisphaeria bacterium]HQL88356.1 MFS transporter [Lentisphaeria bacterium]